MEKQLDIFIKSTRHKEWKLKGVERNIKCMVGVLKEWKLKRSIISDGITLFGKYTETPANLIHQILFTFKPIKNIAKRNRIIRKLFGYKTRKGGKIYKREGMVNQA